MTRMRRLLLLMASVCSGLRPDFKLPILKLAAFKAKKFQAWKPSKII
jgi:hypothetical protein